MIGKVQLPATIATMDRLYDMRQWCQKHARGCWHDNTNYVAQVNFERAMDLTSDLPQLPITFRFGDRRDAMLFKLTFGGAI